MNKKALAPTLIVVVIVTAALTYLILSANNDQQADEPAVNNQPINGATVKTYTNNEYGYSISIPSDWSTQSLDAFEDGNVTFSNASIGFFAPVSNPELTSGGSITIEVEDNLNGYTSADGYVDALIMRYETEDEYGNPPTPLQYEARGTFALGGLHGVLLRNFEGPGGYSDVIYIVNDTYVYELQYYDSVENEIRTVTDEFRSEAQDILGTIEFF